MKFNMNDKVRVKLTEHGKFLHKNNWNAYAFSNQKYEPLKEIDGWSEWILWELMHEFGLHIYNGCKLPFETEIEIIEKKE